MACAAGLLPRIGLAASALAGFLLAACGEESAPTSPPAAPTGLAPDQALEQAAAEYAAQRPRLDVARLLREGERYAIPNACSVDYPDDIDFALTLDDAASGSNESWSLRTENAITYAVLRHDLRQLGYPAALVDDSVADLARDRASGESGIGGAAEDPDWQAYVAETGGDVDLPAPTRKFLQRLWQYRRTEAPYLVPVGPEGDCGAGEMAVRFDIEPDGGRAFFITAFDLRVCRLTGGDPFDRARCPRWREVLDGRDTWMSGRYVYAAEWPDGRRRRGELPIEPVYSDTAPPPIVLRPAP